MGGETACVLWQGGKKLKTCIFRWRGRLSKEHKEWDQFLKSVTLATVCYFDGNWTHCPRMPNSCWSVKKKPSSRFFSRTISKRKSRKDGVGRD